MSSTEPESTAEPEGRTRPPVRLVPAGIVVAAIVIFGVVLILLNALYDSDVSYDSYTNAVPATQQQAPSAAIAESAEATDTSGNVSVCCELPQPSVSGTVIGEDPPRSAR